MLGECNASAMHDAPMYTCGLFLNAPESSHSQGALRLNNSPCLLQMAQSESSHPGRHPWQRARPALHPPCQSTEPGPAQVMHTTRTIGLGVHMFECLKLERTTVPAYAHHRQHRGTNCSRSISATVKPANHSQPSNTDVHSGSALCRYSSICIPQG